MNGIVILLLVFIALFVIFFIVSVFYKGGKREIHIIRKYIDINSKNKSEYSYIIECRYGNSEKMHSLKCDKGMYDKLRIGRKYNVKINLSDIKKICK